ncbi:MAG: hypothetical protein V1776_02545 [Candidatus Diapherotrites archaeon]
MKKAVADTSAIISLAYSGYLEKICETIEIHIPPIVKVELDEIASYSDKLARASRDCIAQIQGKKIIIQDKSTGAKTNKYVGSKVDLGEASCFELAIEENIPIILMDDISAATALFSVAIAKKVTIKLSAAALVELKNQKKISSAELRKGLESMIQNREWGKSAMEMAIRKFVE